MTKYLVGIAALLALAMSAVQTFQVNALSRELTALREKTSASEQQQTRLSALEQQMAESRGDTAALKSSLASRQDELAALEKKMGPKQGQSLGAQTFDVATGKALNFVKTTNPAAGWQGQRWGAKVPPPAPAADPFAADPQVSALDIIRKLYPNAPPPGKDMVVKIIEDGSVVYETPDGKISQQFKDPRITETLRQMNAKEIKATAAPTVTITAPMMTFTAPKAIAEKTTLAPPPVQVADPNTVQSNAVYKLKDGTVTFNGPPEALIYTNEVKQTAPQRLLPLPDAPTPPTPPPTMPAPKANPPVNKAVKPPQPPADNF